MQELHPRGQGRCLRNKYGVHGGRYAERDWKPENRADDDQQCTTRRESPALSEDPRHSAFEYVMDGFFESFVAYLLPQPRPMPAHDLAPFLALHDGNWQVSDDP